jgi:thiol-disulfide isomerase/thioredoxin
MFSMIVHCQGLTVGDTLPVRYFSHVLQYNDSILDLHSFKGKSIIFDFWATNCISCLESFPELDQLQKTFQSNIQIILVNKQAKDVTSAFFKNHPRVHKPSLPIITADSILSNLFPRDFLPYNVWVDSGGVVRYVSSGLYLNEYTLSQFIKGADAGIAQVAEVHQYYKSIIRDALKDRVLYFSCLSRFDPSYRTGNLTGMTDGNFAVYSNNNASVVELFKMAYPEQDGFQLSPARLKIAPSDSIRYCRPEDFRKYDYWLKNYCYTYELRVPKENAAALRNIMRNDLRNFLGLELVASERTLLCLVLRRTGDQDLLATKGGKAVNELGIVDQFHSGNDQLRVLRNKDFRFLSDRLRGSVEYYLKVPFVDETGYQGKIDITLRSSSLIPFNLKNLQQDLERYGLCLDYQPRQTRVYKLQRFKNEP